MSDVTPLYLCIGSNTSYTVLEYNIINHQFKTIIYNEQGGTATSIKKTNKATHNIPFQALYTAYPPTRPKYRSIYESCFNHILITVIIIKTNLT